MYTCMYNLYNFIIVYTITGGLPIIRINGRFERKDVN